MKFSDWWQDKRYQNERRVLIGASVAVVLFSTIFGLMIYYRPLSDLEIKAVEAANPPPVAPVTPVPTAAPPVEKTRTELAAEMVMDGRLVEAEEILNRDEAESRRLRGAIAWKRGNLAEAKTSFERAVSLNPSGLADLCNLAGIQLQLGDVAGAADNLRRAHEVSPDDTFVANRLLLARVQAGDTDQVSAEVSAALKAAPETSLPSVAAAAAALEMKRGNFSKAAEFLNAAKSSLQPEIFESLIIEAPLSEFANNPAISPFYRNQSAASGPAGR